MRPKLKWIAAHFAEIISGTGFALMLVMVSLNVIARFCFSRSFSSSEELAYLGFNYSVFFGVCILYRNRAMIAIDVVVDHMPQMWQRVTNVFVYALLTVGNATMVYYSGKLTIEGWVRPTPALRIPYTFIDLAAFLAFIVLTVYSVKFFIDAAKGRDITSRALEERA